METPTIEELRSARREMAKLLTKKDSKEHDWQRLFSSCPHILSTALPVELTNTKISTDFLE